MRKRALLAKASNEKWSCVTGLVLCVYVSVDCLSIILGCDCVRDLIMAVERFDHLALVGY